MIFSYDRALVQAGQLDEQMRELKQEVHEANRSVARLQNELQMTTGGWQGQHGNPWQVGVPYGSKAGRVASGERDRYGRQVGERGGEGGEYRRGPPDGRGWQK